MFFYLPKLTVFFPEIGNNIMRALGRKKTIFVSGNARPKSNARAHLKQRKKHSGLIKWNIRNNMEVLMKKNISTRYIEPFRYIEFITDILQNVFSC